MKARIIDPKVQVYSKPDPMSSVVADLVAGNEVEMGGIKKVGTESWVAAKLPSGQSGFLPGTVRIFAIRQASLLQAKVTAYVQPSASSPPSAEYKKGTKFLLLDTVTQDEMSWVKIRDPQGKEGYILGNTQLKFDPVTSKDAGKKNMLYGALWCIGGLVVTCVTYSMASEGGSYFIFWGAVIFGAIQFFRGLWEYTRAPA